MSQTEIPGYTYGTDAVSRSPVSLQDLELLQATLLLGPDDRAALRRSRDLLAPRVEEILDVWYGFVGANPTCWPPSPAPTASPTAATWPRSGAASAAGSWTPQPPTTTRPGSRPSCSR
jgi:hypothetical protein